jgi:putative hydrolases of HD superfamily
MSGDTELDGILAFLRTAERLKSTPRSGWTTAGDRESVAAHTWRLSLMAAVLADRFPGIDLARLLKICLIHDLGEALHGDVPAPEQSPETGKAAREREDLQSVLAPLPGRLREELIALWDEYEAARTPEAQLAKGLDKLETILQHTQGLNPADFDYRFNLTYGQAYTAANPILAALRVRLDQATEARAQTPETTETTPTGGAERLAVEFLNRVWGPDHDLGAIDEMMTEDYAITTGGTVVRGREAFKSWVREFQTRLGDARTTSLEAFANSAGDRVVSRWVCTGINNGLLGLPADGRPVSFTGIAIWRIRDGKLAECWAERASWELYRELSRTP